MNKKDDPFITLLKYVNQQTLKGETVHITEVVNHVKSVHPDAHEYAIQYACWNSLETVPDPDKSGYGSLFGEIENEIPRVLDLQSYFNLLEHTELREARAASASALKMARWALSISAFLAGASIVLTLIFQLWLAPDFTMDATQFDEIKRLVESR